ncbi:MAG: ankyrin repeat domain-containing protein, partial [Gammaproteobacteria bacterium]
SFDAISNTIMPFIRIHASKFLYFLIATGIEARKDNEICTPLNEHNLTFITKEEGTALTKTIGAANYFECSTLDYKNVEVVCEAIASIVLFNKHYNAEDVNDVFSNENRLNDAIEYARKNDISALVAILNRKGELYRQWGYSPYHIAVLANNSELCNKLYSADYLLVNAKDKQGLTAYQLAIKEQRIDCAVVLQMLMVKTQQQELLRLAQSEKVRVQSFAQEQQALRHELERLLDKDEFGHLELLKPIYTALLTIRANYFANRNLYPSNFDIERLKSPAALLDDTCRKKYELNQQKSKLIKTDRLFRHLNEQISSLEKLTKQLKRPVEHTSIITIIQQLQDGYKSYIEAVCNASQNKREDLYRLRVLLSSATSPSGFLKMTVANTLTTGRDSDQSSGLHAVHKIGYIHFKEKPHAPGVEFIVTSLGNLLAGQGATPTELFKIINEQGCPYVFQASKTVIGQELATLIKHSPTDINKIKESNYSAMVFLSLLTDPQDGKPDNFMIKYDTDGSIVIVGIDNDIAFADPIVLKHETGENKGKHFVNIRNVLYFLPQMQQPVDKGFLEIFLKQRPEIILTEWLMSIVNKNKDYESLLLQGIFNETDFQGDKISDKRGLQLPIRFSVGTISKMYRKLVRLQDKLQETNETNSEVSHQTLFELLEPEVAKHYKGVQAKNKDDIHECIKTLYEESITNWSELKKFREGLERGDTRLMTTQAIKTATEHGFEDNRTQVMIDTFKELLQEIIYDRADEVAPLLYKKLDELSMCIKQQPLLHIIAEIRHQNLLKWLVKHELLNDVNQLNKNGYSALHITASLGDIDMVKLLVEEGHADVTIKNKLNRTPLEVAKDRGHTAVAAYLSTFPPEELVQYNIKLV